MPSISARVDEEIAEDVDAALDLLGADEEATIRKALAEGLATLRIRVAVERFQTGEVSVGEAAAIADCTVAEWLEIAHEKNLTTQYSPEELDDDAATVTDR